MERIRVRANLSATALGTLLLATAAIALVVLAARLGPATPAVGGDPLPSDSALPSNAPLPPSEPLPLEPLPLPPDVLALGTEVTSLAPHGVIPLDQAVDVALREYPFIQQGQIDGYLVELTDPSVVPGFHERPIWIIRASGLSSDIFSAPMGPDGTAADVGLATLGYIYVDALTGQWLQALFQGDPPTD